jgi:hypothetical protein
MSYNLDSTFPVGLLEASILVVDPVLLGWHRRICLSQIYYEDAIRPKSYPTAALDKLFAFFLR